jgi:hypothetical protein
MKAFSIDYYILVTVSAVGVFQLVAMHGGLRGLLVLRPSRISALIWAALPIAAVAWFFITKDRKVSDHMGGLSSNEIALAFFVGVVTAWVFTVAFTSILNHRRGMETGDTGTGLETLSRTTYFRAVLRSVRCWYGEWRS